MKVGDTIELVNTNDPWTELVPGDRGVITYISKYSDPQTIGVKWDNGSTLSMLDGVDRFRVVVSK